MYRGNRVIWIDGGTFTLAALMTVCATIMFGLARHIATGGYKLPLFLACGTFALLAAFFSWLSYRIGRQRKARYDARPNKVLPRGAKRNADRSY